MGRFRGMDETDLIIQDKIEGNLFVMVDKVVDLLRAKYLMSPISYEGMLRIETLEIPEKALRETIINALIHRDYASAASISLRVFDSKIVVWNDGELNKISIADLKKHTIHILVTLFWLKYSLCRVILRRGDEVSKQLSMRR